MIKELLFDKQYDEKIVIALGFFDCIHIAHIELLKKAKEIADRFGAKLCMFTFRSDKTGILYGNEGSVLTYEERLQKAERLGVDCVLFADFDERFMNISANDFIFKILNNFEVKGIVCGFDYTFGKNAEGNSKTIEDIAQKNGIIFEVIKKREFCNKKISTTDIKILLKGGEIKTANVFLAEPYFISGVVVEGRKVGRKIGFPTANILKNIEKMPIKYGVYKTFTYIDGKVYKGITNFGNAPTFNENKMLFETHIDGFSGNLYGKRLTIYFEDYLRPIGKFSSVDELKNRLTKDLESIR